MAWPPQEVEAIKTNRRKQVPITSDAKHDGTPA